MINVVIECTLLKNEGVPCDVNNRVLIRVEAVEHYISRSKGNVVIIQLLRLDPLQQSQVSNTFSHPIGRLGGQGTLDTLQLSQESHAFSVPGTIDYTTGFL